ncbi:MAG: PKD domain-containing protein [Chitinophagaceae bacterium]|nr:PKD domain-containing protein [Chitinophagaceae bacterium]
MNIKKTTEVPISTTAFYNRCKKYFFLLTLLLVVNKISVAQCPPNIDFEQGNFSNWLINTGSFNGAVIINPVPILPIPGRHDIITSSTVPALDQWGQFPTLCPNGSGYSVRIGVENTGTNADRVTYRFTIPPTQNNFSLIYNYAIVINNTGGHPANIQPRLTVNVRNITDNTVDACASFDIAYSNANPLPGFQDAPSNPSIKFKPWAANSIDLNGNAGKTIEISFTATGCGAGGGTHFGYAYIDVNSQCQSSFLGSAYCPDDTAVNVTAPFGYQFYKWWDITNPTVPLATTQTINFTPPPPSGMTLQVALDPFNGYGCPDTLTVQLMDTLNVFATAGPDRLSCEKAPVQLGVNPTPGFVYSWDPVTDLSNPNISNPIATPSVTTTYVLTVRNFGGGCLTTDTVTVKAAVLDTTVNVTGQLTGCITPANPTRLKVGRGVADSIQWYRNNIAIPGATDTVYNVVQTGAYHVTLFSLQGCNLSSTDVNIFVNPTPVVDFTTNSFIQCFNGHQFVFTNNSTIAFGTMNYNWNLGDGTILTTPNVTHSYADTGTYIVRLIVTSDQGCIDSISYTVTVYESPVAAFDVNTRAICQKINDFIFTNSSTLGVGTMKYLWDFGDGNTDTTLNARHYYRNPGTYTVRLTSTSDKGCPNDSAFNITVNPEPVVGFSEPNAEQCFGNNQFNFINTSTVLTGSMQYLWNFGDGTTSTFTNATHSYTAAGEYTVKMVATTDSGCVDSIYKNVKIFKYAIADFKVDPACVNQRLALFNQTINTSPSVLTWLWEFGNGATAAVYNPVYSYPAAGTYTIKLSVSNIHCPQTVSVKQMDITIDEPLPGTRYADVVAVMNFPEQLQARQIANTVLWTPATSLDLPNSYRPTFKGLASQLYHVQLKTKTGCVTVDTQMVNIKKKIEIYVPNTFTPDGNGRNDYLYPVLMGFKTLKTFKVFDRWGKLLFHTTTERPGWDGRVKGDRQEIQTVVWMVEAVDVDGVTHKRQGSTVILH